MIHNPAKFGGDRHCCTEDNKEKFEIYLSVNNESFRECFTASDSSIQF